MLGKAQKWGNSLAVRIPKSMAEECSIEAELPVEIIRDNDVIIIKAVRKQRLSLDSLLCRITADNIHSVVATGTPVGKEIW